MYVLRLGAISALLSETLVSGFTTGAAFQVITSQIKDLLGLKIPKYKGLFVVTNVSSLINRVKKNLFGKAIIQSDALITPNFYLSL